MLLLNPRLFFALTAAAGMSLLAFGYYLQYGQGLEPCPMCIFQRLCFMAVVALALIGALHGPRGVGAVVYGGLIALTAAGGAAIAARQVWLQHLPEDQIPQCGPGLDYMLDMYPLAEVITKALRGTGECATVDWAFLGRSIAEWSLLCFSLMFVAYVVFIVYRLRHGP
ncbi:MAG: disulfide bond formation protein B [Gammaproteobacteria bacterium]